MTARPWLALWLATSSALSAAATAPANVLRAPALSPEDRAFVEALDSGRYGLVVEAEGVAFFEDKSERPSENRFLPLEAVESLLRPRGAAVVAELRRKVRDRALTAADRWEANHQLWDLRRLHSAEDLVFLAEIAGAGLSHADPSAAVGLRDPGRAAVPVLAKPAALYSRLLTRVSVQEKDPERAAFLQAALREMLDSPTAREYARRLIASGLKIGLSFKNMPGTVYNKDNGVEDFDGVQGTTRYADGVATVGINEAYLKIGRSPRDIAGLIAHEALGHGVENHLAAKLGLADAFDAYAGDETNALLLGYRVDAELGRPLNEARLWNYLRDKRGYYRENIFNDPAYAVGLSLPEMRRPIAVLEGRVRRVRAYAEELKKERAQIDALIQAIGHFTDARGPHKIPAERFRLLSEELAGRRDKGIPAELETQDGILAALANRIDDLKENGDEAAALATASRNPQFARWEAEIARHEIALRRLTRGRRRDSEGPRRPADQITWSEFEDMVAADKKARPTHWPAKTPKGPSRFRPIPTPFLGPTAQTPSTPLGV